MARILIVDDSPTEVYVLKTLLERFGHEIHTAGSGEEGVQVARSLLPDLILMDVVMPGLNGFQATRQLVKEPATAAIPIVIISNKDQEVDRMWGLRQGAQDYLTKPVKEADLLRRIDHLLKART